MRRSVVEFLTLNESPRCGQQQTHGQLGGGISKNVRGKSYRDVSLPTLCHIDVIVSNRHRSNTFQLRT